MMLYHECYMDRVKRLADEEEQAFESYEWHRAQDVKWEEAIRAELRRLRVDITHVDESEAVVPCVLDGAVTLSSGETCPLKLPVRVALEILRVLRDGAGVENTWPVLVIGEKVLALAEKH